MTWNYDISSDKNSIDVYDHNGDLIDTVNISGVKGVPAQDGFCPDAVWTVMMQEAVDEFQSRGWSSRLLAILRDAVFNQVVEGTPSN